MSVRIINAKSLCLLALLLFAAGVTGYFALPPKASAALQQAPPGASVSVKVQVPGTMRTSPFDVDRYLNVPPNFSISVYARIGGARFMAVAPSGDLFVSRPGSGSVMVVRPNPTTGGDPSISTYVSGLRGPHDMVFHTINGTTYLYISESNQINRYIYNYGDTTAGNRQVVITNLPDSSSPELQGAYGHELKNIALDANHKLYLSVASATNSSPSDTTSDPVRCAIYQYDADGTNRRLYARGLRNAEGLAVLPATNDLWVAVNNRDNIGYPFNNDWDGDGSNDYGKVMQSYVDNHPPEEFTRVRDGGNYGWPFANPNPDTANGFDNMPFDLDVQNNADGSSGAATSFDRISKGIQAHSAPLGLSFLQDTAFPQLYRTGAVIALHGSWNRSTKTGYKVIYFPWIVATQTPGAQVDLVTGWAVGNSDWGRPVDAVVDLQGNLLISDDASGTIYKLTYNEAAPTPTPTPVPVPTQTPAPAPVVDPSAYYEFIVKSSGKALDVPGASVNPIALIQWTINNGYNQQWKFVPVGSGYYKIFSRNSNLVLDISGNSTNNGGVLIQYSDNNGDNQKWRLDANGDGTYKIVNKNSGLVLDVAGASTQNGAQVFQWTSHGGNNQRWSLVKVQ